MRSSLEKKIGVLSVQVPMIGHKVFGTLLRREFADSQTIDFHAYWTDDQREPYARVLNGLLRQRLPFAWAAERNVDLRRVRAELGYAFYGRRLVQRMRRRHPIDVLHFNTQTAALLSTDFISRTPSVITLDETASQISLETDEPWRWTHAPSVRLERPPLRAAAAVVPFSRWAAASVVRSHGIEPERVHVIPIGIHLPDFAAIDSTRRFGEGERPLRVLFVGSDFVRKGGPLLVDVFLERFAERGTELHLVTGASGILKHPQIVVHSAVSAFSPEWKKLYSSADVFVLPTRWEAFGIVFVEAMAAGLPVIGTSISAIPEIVAENETGFLIAKDDGRALAERLELLLSNEALRRRLGQNGRRRVAESFDSHKNAARLGELFCSLARATNARSGSEVRGRKGHVSR